MSYTKNDFEDLLVADLWILEGILSVPKDPEPIHEKIGESIDPSSGKKIINYSMRFSETIGMDLAIEKVIEYQKSITQI